MDTYANALQKILGTVQLPGTELVPLQAAYHRGLTAPAVSDIPMPPFHKSAMDGFACARIDLDKPLRIADTVYAGKTPPEHLKPGECVKIMTGAAVPRGADTVFIVEHSEMVDESHVKCTNLHTKANICYRGEDLQIGDCVVPQYTFLDERHIPLLAGAGYARVQVYKQPKVAVLATGTELLEPGEELPPFKIRNSNSYQVLSQLKALGLRGAYKGILPDDLDSISRHIKMALKQSDVLILSGGVSVGDYDYVPELLEKEGMELLVNGTAIQPGKPMVFGAQNGKYVFGLSGNPVSSFIQFQLYMLPFLKALMGCTHTPLRFRLPIASEFSRKKDSRLQFVPANITEQNTVEPIPFHGSAHIDALSRADFLMEIPIGVTSIRQGEEVTLRKL